MSTYQDRAKLLAHEFGISYPVEARHKREQALDRFLSELASIVEEEKQELVKAFGGCTKCYGKGYSTVRRGLSYRKNGVYATHEINQDMDYCSCERGKQLRDQLSNRSKGDE